MDLSVLNAETIKARLQEMGNEYLRPVKILILLMPLKSSACLST